MTFRKSSFEQDPMEATGSFTGAFDGTIESASFAETSSFALNAGALIDINASLGTFFSIGTKSTNGRHFAGSSQEPGNSSNNFIQQLVLVTGEVPEPSTLALFAIALAGLGFFMTRRRRVA